MSLEEVSESKFMLCSSRSIGYQDGPFDQRLLSIHVAFLSSSIRYQDSPFKLKTAFEVTRDCHTLDFPQVLCFELQLHFKFYFFQNHILPSFPLSPIFLHKLQKHSLTLCIFLQFPQTQHKLFRSLNHLFEGLGT